MDKTTFLSELEKELKGLSESDRQNALAYYREYLDDAESAGHTDADNILGSPRTLSAQIKADIAMAPLTNDPYLVAPPVPTLESSDAPEASPTKDFSAPPQPAVAEESTEPISPETSLPEVQQAAKDQQGYTPQQAPEYQQAFTYQQPAGYQQGYTPQPPTGYSRPQEPYTPQPTTGYTRPQQPLQPKGSKKSGIGVIWTVVIAILAIPVGLPLAIALFAVIISVLAVLFSFLVALAAVVIALLVAGVATGAAGFFLLFVNPPTGMFYFGAGLVSLGFAILLGIAFWLLGRLCITGVAKLFNSIRKKLTKKEGMTQ